LISNIHLCILPIKNIFFRSQSIINQEFKICVHTRRGDFVELQQSTNKHFTEKAISYILNSVKVFLINVK